MKKNILVLFALLLISFGAKAQEISGIETARTINVVNFGVSDLDVFFGNNQQLIAYSNNSGRNEGDTLVIYDYKNDKILSKIKGTDWKFDIQFINENQLLYFNNNIIYKVENFSNPVVTELFKNGMIESFIVSPDKSKVLINSGTTVQLFSYDGAGPLSLLKTFSVTGFELAISNDNKYIAVSGGYNNDYINLINTDDSSITKITTSVHNGTYSPAFFNQDNQLKLAVGGGYSGGSIEIIDVLTKTLEQSSPEFTNYNYSISVDPTQKYMVCGGFEGTINMVSINSDSFTDVFSQNSGFHINKIKFSQDARYIISGHGAGSLAKLVVHKVKYRGSKTLAVTAGGLATALTTAELDSISYLTLTGTIDARDFKTMRDNMLMLAEIDLSGIKVVAYTGTEGTAGINYGSFSYPENAIPFVAFMNFNVQRKVSIKNIILSESITEISDQAFNYCSGLTSVNFPNGLVKIGHHAFSYCSSLTSVRIPVSVTTIGEGAFSMNKCSFVVDLGNSNYSSPDSLLFNKTQSILIQCPGYKTGDYKIPSSVTSIGNSAFSDCKKLTSVTIPSSVKSIGQGAFVTCSGLTSISIPLSVTSIGSQAFAYCSNLSSIVANPTNPVDLSLSNSVFDNINKTTCKLYVPFGSKPLYAVANQWQDFVNIVEMPGLNLSSNSLTIGSAANSQGNIDLVSNADWTATSGQTWLSVSPMSGSANAKLTFTAQANTTPLPRIAKVTVSASGIDPQTVTVTQSFVKKPLVGTFTINPVGGDFVSFTDATTALNMNGVGPGGVRFLVAPGTTYNESGMTIRTNTSGESNPVAFQKDGAGANPIIYGKKVAGNDTTSVIFLIAGSDYITFDGVDITSDPAAINDSAKILGGYVITNLNSITNGSNHITIKNCKIDIDRRSNQDQQNGILLNQDALSSNGINSNILIDHVQFMKGRSSIRSNGTTIPDENIEIRNCTFGEVGTTIEPIDYDGLISVTNCKNLSFHDNEIQNIVAPDFYAIETKNLTGDNHIYNNKIHNLRSTSTIEDSDLFGIYSASTDANAIVNVYNNLIYDLEGAKSSSTLASNTYWNLQIIDLVGNAKYKIFNNTVITNSKNQHENTMVCWANLYSEIKNNIFADFSVPGPNSFRSIVLVESVFENNLVWMDDTLQNNFVFSNLYKFHEWQKGTRKPSQGNHLTNIFANPNFTDPANLDYTIKSPSPVSDNGKPIGFILSDLYGTTRNTATPDIGAIEGDFGPAIDLLPPVISFQPITNNSLAIVKLTAEITDNTKVANAKLWFRVKGSVAAFTPVQGNQYGNLWEFILPALSLGEYEYFVCAKDVSGNIASNGFVVSGLDANSTGLLENNPPARPDFVYSFSYNMQLTEFLNYTVGIGGNFESLTKPGGLFEMLNSSFIDRNIQVTIISDLSETGEIPLQQLRKTGTGNYSITIKPNSASLKTITNLTASNINFLGADIIAIDGSFNGDNLNHLKFVCNGANPLRFFNIDAFGNHDITIKYCDFSSTSFACIYAYGSSRSSFTIDHVNALKGYSGVSLTNFGNTSIKNCIIGNSDINNSMTNFGIYLSGCSNIAIENNTIMNVVNTVNLSAQGIWLSNVTGGNITRNKIINVTNKSISGSQVSNGLYGSGCRNITVSNNIISGINGNGHPYLTYMFGIKGIVLTASNNLKLYYNTVNLYGEGNTSANAQSFVFCSNNSVNLDIRNNIFSNTINNSNATTFSDLLIQSINEPTNIFRNNLYYNGGDNAFATPFSNGGIWSNFKGWQSSVSVPGDGLDLGSGFSDPKFTNPVTNELSLQASSPAINSGNPVSVTTDFYGNQRSATTPDIGAIEDNSMALSIDIIAPVIEYAPIPSSTNTTPLFSATITDNIAVAAAKLWYRKRGTVDEFTPVTGVKQVDNKNWNFSIQSALTPNITYEYYVCAKDAANNIVTNGITSLALNTETVGLTINNPAVNSSAFRSFKVAELSVTLGTINGSPFYVSATQIDTIPIPFTKTSNFNYGNEFTAYLSDANGSFASETTIGKIMSGSDNVYEGNYSSVGFRIHPTAGTYTVNQQLTFIGINSNTVHKTQVGDFPAYGLDITVTDQTFAVKGQTVYRCSLQITGMANPADQTVYSDYNGEPMNYYNPVSKVFELYYSYNNAAPRKIRETNTLVNTFGIINNTVAAGTGYKIRLKSSQPIGIISSASNAFEIRKVDYLTPVVNLYCTNASPVSAPFEVAIKFNEYVTGFVQDMLKTDNATLSDFTVKVPGKEYTVMVTPINTGNVTVMVEENNVVDLAGNPNGASNLIVLTYIELEAPLLNISTTSGVDTLYNSPSEIIFTFNQDITGFISNNINVVNGSISNFVSDGTNPNKIFRADLTPRSLGMVKITVDDDVAYNAALKGNCKSTLNLTYIGKVNVPPVANAGTDQSVNEGVLVTLDGSSSTDLDGNALTYKWTAPAGIALSSITDARPTFTAPDVLEDTPYTFSLVVNDGYEDSQADQVIITIMNPAIPAHFTPVWTGNGYDHMNINIYSAKIDGADLEAGDEIGIFDGTLCVGVGILTMGLSESATLAIVVSRNDGSGNGYTQGNAITYKLYDQTKTLEITNVTAAYSNGLETWSTDGKFALDATAFAALTGVNIVKHDIALIAGWNIISANVVPANLNLKDIFQSHINSGNLKKVMDEAGKTVENFGIFGGWKNNIGNLTATEGYKVNMGAATTLSLEGTPVPLPLDIPLSAGWSIISYPSTTLQDGKALVQPLINAGKIIKVMDESGKTIENFGIFGGWKNNIGNFAPGKGYKVNVTAACTLTISANATKAAAYVPEVMASVHFTKVFDGNGTDHMNISLVDLQTSGLRTGDEIGVFDGKYCVGSATIGIEQLISGSISIPASANEGSGATVNGFTTGNAVGLQLYRGNQSYTLETETLTGVRSFEKNASVLIKVSANGLPVVLLDTEQDKFRCYPNPFKDELTIEIRNSEETGIDVAIYNLLGQKIKNLYKGTNKGELTLKWNGTNDSGHKVAQGVYLCKMNGQAIKVVYKH